MVRLLAAYRDIEELVQIGAYARGSSPETDVAIEYHRAINAILQQRRDERPAFEQARSVMLKTAYESGDLIQQRSQQLAAGGRLTPAGAQQAASGVGGGG